ncbi:MAG: 1,4-alpha-glucan branching protein GlgB, partial [Deltaproteobacteria bacterium]|nr:1,4-alpha-glucan branching protein GlgB [Deltaproteobacteria bacterium]
LFCMLDGYFAQKNKGTHLPWREWPAAYRSPDTPEVKKLGREQAKEVVFHQWLQFVTEEQLGLAAQAAREGGLELGIYQDMALGVDPAGADAWGDPHGFATLASAGAPPDPLGPLGQNWGLTPPVPHQARKDRYDYFIRVVRAACRHAGALRIDHIIGLLHLFWIPQGEPTAHGAYVTQDFDALLGLIALESHQSRTLIIGEDLGTVPPGLRDKMVRYGVLSTRLMVFERQGDGYSPAESYPAEAMVAFTTHDLHTLDGYWAGHDLTTRGAMGLLNPKELDEALVARQQDKRRLVQRLEAEGLLPVGRFVDGTQPELPPEIRVAVMAFMARTPCRLGLVNQEELFGEISQQNVPGTVTEHPNWSTPMRHTLEELEQNPRIAKAMIPLKQALAPFHESPVEKERLEEDDSEPGGLVLLSPKYDVVVPPGFWEPLIHHACHDPHALLGLHPHPGGRGMVLSAWQPQAAACWAAKGRTDAPEGPRQPLQQVHPAGGFRLEFPEEATPFVYHLITVDRTGHEQVFEDPYAFGPVLGELDIYLLGEGTHRASYDKLGAHPMVIKDTAGVHFAVWAPNAMGVCVVGNFNHWREGAHPMRILGGSGVWEVFIPGLALGEVYKFSIRSHADGRVRQKTDPYAFKTEFRPRTASIVAHVKDYPWTDGDWMETRNRTNWLESPVSIYEAHLGSWRRGGTHGETFLDYREMTRQLIPYLKELGFTHVELLPVMEHPLDESWGYQVVNHYAPTARFGAPEDFQWMVDQFHQNGIGVILDWVPGHFPKDEHGLAMFDGTHLYNHADPRLGEHKGWGTHVFNYSRHEVRNFLISNALFWLEHYHVDGLRVDAVASMLYLDYDREEGEWVTNAFGGRENLEAVDFIKEFNIIVHERTPGVLTIAEESTAWGGVSHPTYTGGLGFSLKWNMGWMHDTLDYFAQDPVYRKYHHNEITFSLLYAFHENFVLVLSHDEVVHGKGSMVAKMAGDDWQKFANLRLLYTQMWTHPGKKLLFMGGEFAQWREWTATASLDWHLLDSPLHRGMKDLIRDLNRVYRENPPLFQMDFNWTGFDWVDCHDSEASVLTFLRWDNHRQHHLLTALSFTPVPRMDYRVGVPENRFYRELINSDAAQYGGSGLGNFGGVQAEEIPWHGQPYSVRLTLPPLGGLILKPE